MKVVKYHFTKNPLLISRIVAFFVAIRRQYLNTLSFTYTSSFFCCFPGFSYTVVCLLVPLNLQIVSPEESIKKKEATNNDTNAEKKNVFI